MRKIWIVGLVGGLLLGLWGCAGFQTLTHRNEPDGFRGIRWGTDISTLEGMEYLSTDPSYGGMNVYAREGDSLYIGGAKLQSINYDFWRGKFCSVVVHTKGYINFSALKDACFARFRKGFQPNRYIEKYV